MPRTRLDETKVRRRIVPEEEVMTPEPVEPVEMPVPEPAPVPELTTFTLTSTDVPLLADKSVGDRVSLNIEVEITDIADDVYTLNLISVKETPKKIPGKEKEVVGEALLIEELRRLRPARV